MTPSFDVRPRAEMYIKNHLDVVPVEPRSKVIKVPGWQKTQFTVSDFSPSNNIGLRLGKNGLADVDLDCEEARKIADIFLPETGFVFGRASARASHYFYFLDPPSLSIKLMDPVIGQNKGGTIAELRCLKTDGSIGFQTVAPGSIHESTGEKIEFESGTSGIPQNADAAEVIKAVKTIGAACLLARYFPAEGHGRNDTLLAIAGILARYGWSFEEANQFNFAIYRLLWGAQANKSACTSEVKPTFAKFAAGNTIYGIPKLKELIDARVVDRALEWLGIDKQAAKPAEEPTQATEQLGVDLEVADAIARDDMAAIWNMLQTLAAMPVAEYQINRAAIKAHFKTKISIAALDAEVDDLRPADESEEDGSFKAPPNKVANQILAKHHFLNVSDNLYLYDGKKWATSALSYLNKLALEADGEKTTTKQRRAEIVSFMSSKIYTNKHEWRQIQPYEVPVANGVIDIRTMEMRPHRKEDYLQTCIPWAYSEKAQCPELMKCLDTYFGKDDDGELKIAALQEYFGYCLMPHARYKKALLCVGESDCGKSTIPYLLRQLLGSENIAAVSVEHMDDDRKRAPLLGKLVNLLTELTSDAMIADGGFKTLVSTEEPILFDPKHLAPVMDIPICKHVIVTNKKPRINDKSNATYRRLLLIHFNHVIPASEQDTNVWDRLKGEIDGILSWALEGAQRLHANGGRFSDPGIAEIAAYRDDQNPMLTFLEHYCERCDPSERKMVRTSHFIDRFKASMPGKWSASSILEMAREVGLIVDKNPRRDEDKNRYRYVHDVAFQ